MTEEENRLITEKLGICWHEIEWVEGQGLHCKACGVWAVTYDDPHWHYPDKLRNPDFSHRDAFWIIMEEGPKQEWWKSFMRKTSYYQPMMHYNEDMTEYLRDEYSIRQDYIGPRLAESLLDFIKNRA